MGRHAQEPVLQLIQLHQALVESALLHDDRELPGELHEDVHMDVLVGPRLPTGKEDEAHGPTHGHQGTRHGGPDAFSNHQPGRPGPGLLPEIGFEVIEDPGLPRLQNLLQTASSQWSGVPLLKAHIAGPAPGPACHYLLPTVVDEGQTDSVVGNEIPERLVDPVQDFVQEQSGVHALRHAGQLPHLPKASIHGAGQGPQRPSQAGDFVVRLRIQRHVDVEPALGHGPRRLRVGSKSIIGCSIIGRRGTSRHGGLPGSGGGARSGTPPGNRGGAMERKPSPAPQAPFPTRLPEIIFQNLAWPKEFHKGRSRIPDPSTGP